MEALEIVRMARAAMSSHDDEGAARLATDDIEVVTPVGEARGREAVRVLARAYMDAFPDSEWVVPHYVASGDTVVTEYLLEGTHVDTLTTPSGDVPARGRQVVMSVCDVSRVRDDQVVSTHVYWDNLAFMQAAGAIPGPIARRIGPHPPKRAPLGTQQRTPTDEAIVVVDRMYAALNAHDAATLATCAAEECEIESPVGEVVGRLAFARLGETLWKAFSDATWTPVHRYAFGDTVATEHVVEGTHDGPLPTVFGDVPPSGNRVAMRACDISRVHDGEIESTHVYSDYLAFLQAIGEDPTRGDTSIRTGSM